MNEHISRDGTTTAPPRRGRAALPLPEPDWRKVAAVYRSLLTDMDPERLDEIERRHTTKGER